MKNRSPIQPKDLRKYSEEQCLEAFERVEKGSLALKQEGVSSDVREIILGIRYFRKKYALQSKNIPSVQGMMDYIVDNSPEAADIRIIAQFQRWLDMKKTEMFVDYHRALNNSAVVQKVDRNGIIIYVNDLYREISWDNRDIIGKNAKIMGWKKYHPPEFWKDMWDTILRGEIWRGVVRNPRMNSKESFYTQTTITPLRNENGEIDRFIAVKFDITEQKHLEEEMRATRNRIVKIFDATPQWFWEINEDLEILNVNEAFCNMVGYSRNEIIGRKIYDFFDNDNRKILDEQVHTIGTTDHRKYTIELLRKNGTTLPVILHATTIRNEQGDIIDIVAHITDVFELHEASEKDALTGIYNRRSFDRDIQRCFANIKEGGLERVSIAIFDIDHFKTVNDDYGHPVWDMVLRKVGSLLRSIADDKLSVYRYGWEEFVIIGQDMDIHAMKNTVEKFRRVIENTEIELEDKKGSFWFTVSAWVTTHKPWENQFNTPDELVKSADGCLYKAKEDGRNRTKIEERKSLRPDTEDDTVGLNKVL